MFGSINTFCFLPKYKVINVHRNSKNTETNKNPHEEENERNNTKDDENNDMIKHCLEECNEKTEQPKNDAEDLTVESHNINTEGLMIEQDDCAENNGDQILKIRQPDKEGVKTNTYDMKQECTRAQSQPTFKQCTPSPFYISLVIWYSLVMLRYSLFWGTLLPWLSDIYPENDQKVAHLLTVLGFITLLSLCIAPMFGYVLDRSVKKYKMTYKNFWARSKPAQYVLLATSILAVLLSIACLNTQEWAIYSALVLIVLYTPGIVVFHSTDFIVNL